MATHFSSLDERLVDHLQMKDKCNLSAILISGAKITFHFLEQ
jgi:hypothetical protein